MVYIRGQHRLFRVQKVMGLLEISTYKAMYDGSDFKKGAWTDAAWSAGL